MNGTFKCTWKRTGEGTCECTGACTCRRACKGTQNDHGNENLNIYM